MYNFTCTRKKGSYLVFLFTLSRVAFYFRVTWRQNIRKEHCWSIYSKTSLLCMHCNEKFITSWEERANMWRVRLRFNDIRREINYKACMLIFDLNSFQKYSKLDLVCWKLAHKFLRSCFKWPGINLTVTLLLHDDIFMIFFFFI